MEKPTEVGIVHDICGKVISVGDYIIYATSRGRSPALKFGFVLDFKPPLYSYEGEARIKVIGVDTNYSNSNSAGWVNRMAAWLRFPQRIVVITEKSVPAAVIELMDTFKSV